MILARIIGNVVSTEKASCYEGHRLLMVQPVNEVGIDQGASFLAFDTVQAAPGDLVLVEREGNCARELLGKSKDPFHAVIIGIVDQILGDNNDERK